MRQRLIFAQFSHGFSALLPAGAQSRPWIHSGSAPLQSCHTPRLDGAVCSGVLSLTSAACWTVGLCQLLQHPLLLGSPEELSPALKEAVGRRSPRAARDRHHSAAARCLLLVRPAEKAGQGERGKETEEDRQLRGGETRNAVSQRHLSAQMKWKQRKGNTALLFSKLYFQLNELKRKISFPFPAILRDLFAKSAGLVGETRSIYFLYTLVIYEVAINAEFMEVKSGHEIKRILFKYLSLLILSNSSQRRRWVRMHTRFTEY